MFELSILRKYLIPRKRQFSAALIAFVSVGVISAVVCLVLLFLSVTEGIEKNWLKKLTSLQAPIRVTPTSEYLNSYYYLADTISQDTDYQARSLHEKLRKPGVDLYNPAADESYPSSWPAPEKNPDGTLKDPAIIAAQLIQAAKIHHPDLEYVPFAMSGAILKLQLSRSNLRGGETQSFLTQASYLSSFPEESSYIRELLIPPTLADFQHLLFQSFKTATTETLLSQLTIQRVKTAGSSWHVPMELLPEHQDIPAKALQSQGRILSIALGPSSYQEKGVLRREGNQLFWNGTSIQLAVVTMQPVEWNAQIVSSSIAKARKISDLRLKIDGTIGDIPLRGEISWNGLEISQASIHSNPEQPLWLQPLKNRIVLPILPSQERGVVLAKGFYDSGVRIGDRGWLQYQAVTAGSLQEQRLPIFVAGFYDPGVLAVGNKCILAPADIVHLIQTASPVEHFDKTMSMGFSIWHRDLKKSTQVAQELQEQFSQAGIAPYWTITTYHDYEFSKDLFKQFQSDRYLFTFLGLIVLVVACSNIVSFLILLVQDKKREIGILQALGASKRSIALIFGGCGVTVGLLSSLIGIGAAFLILRNLDTIIKFLSFLQGHAAFNSAFYGSSLPSEMSISALLFVAIITPLLSLIAGLIPAWKACKLSPSSILRSE